MPGGGLRREGWLDAVGFDLGHDGCMTVVVDAFRFVDQHDGDAVGDDIAPTKALQTFSPTSQQEALEAIQSMMAQARQNAPSPFDAAQAQINEIYFSEDWKLLRDSAVNYSDLAINGRGELEWFFEPVILLFLNEEQALQDLIQNRVLKYDPLNGTGHAYSVRQYLISGQYGKAHDRLKQAEVATFSSRIAEVKGYLLIAERDGAGLSQHLENVDIISPLHRDYFHALNQYFKGDIEGARKTLLSSDALTSERIHQALGLHHIGDKLAAQSLLNEIASEQMGRLLLTISLSYGAACGDKNLPPIDKLDQIMMKFNIETLPCIGSR